MMPALCAAALQPPAQQREAVADGHHRVAHPLVRQHPRIERPQRNLHDNNTAEAAEPQQRRLTIRASPGPRPARSQPPGPAGGPRAVALSLTDGSASRP